MGRGTHGCDSSGRRADVLRVFDARILLTRLCAATLKKIKALIETSVESVSKGNALVDEAGVTIAEGVKSVERVTQIVQGWSRSRSRTSRWSLQWRNRQNACANRAAS